MDLSLLKYDSLLTFRQKRKIWKWEYCFCL